MHFAPIMIQRMLEVPNRESSTLRTLQCVHYASAPMPVPLLRRAIARSGPIFVQVYGMTECLGGTMLKAHHHVLEGDERDVARLASAGQPYSRDRTTHRPDGRHRLRSGRDRRDSDHRRRHDEGLLEQHRAQRSRLRDGWVHTQRSRPP